MEDQLPGEHDLVIPDAWRRSLHARRGGAPGPKTKVPGPAAAARAVQGYVEKSRGVVEALLEGGAGDPELTEAARRHLDGQADPAGAAVVAVVTATGAGGHHTEKVQRAYVDAWVAEHGVGFAACALVELSRTTVARKGGGTWLGTWVGADRITDEYALRIPEQEAKRVRGLLAAASDADYAAAVERLAEHRSGWCASWLVSYLVPTREDWVEECCAAPAAQTRRHDLMWVVMPALGKPEQLAAPYPARGLHWGQATRALLASMADGIGPGVLPFLLAQADGLHLESDDRKRIYETVAILPTDEAFQALLDRLDGKPVHKHVRAALGEAARRFPVRALRLLALAGAGDLLAAHVEAHPELVDAALPGLPEDVAAAVRRVASAPARVPDAAPDELPAVLVDPPWLAPRRPVLKGLTLPEPRLVWQEGEREEWLQWDPKTEKPDDPDWEALVEAYTSAGHDSGNVQLMVYGPEELIRPLMPRWKGHGVRWAHVWMRPLAARYELDALPSAIRTARAFPDNCCEPLMPYLGGGVATFMAGGLVKRGALLIPARQWFGRHGLDAVPLLVPAALAEKPKDWRPAETALRYLQDKCGLDEVVGAARDAHGEEAAEAVRALLSTPPLGTGLEEPPKVGAWLDPTPLPQVLLRGRDRALPRDAVGRLVETLAFPTPYGVEELAEAFAPGTLAEFGWALFRQWLDAGKPSKDAWALRQLGRTGDDDTVRLLTPVIRAWPGEGGHKNAVHGLDVLAEIGTDVALMHLHGIAQKVKFKGLQAEAQERIRQVAKRLDLTTEQLADRLVPDFGLDAEGGMTLDYGPRKFLVRFDEQLKPFVADEDGKRRASLPKPSAKDDPELAPAAHKAFAGLKKDVRTVAADQLRRLEQAMVTRRRWTPAEFGEYIVRHPLVWHIARRLVWLAEDGGTTAAFRIAEDRTFADAGDDAFALPGTARVGVAHPLDLGDAVKAWTEVFADYEITQPFPQLARPVHALTEQERGSGRLERFEGLKLPFGDVLGLVKLGWERGAPLDAGVERWIHRRVADRRYVVIDLDPGFAVGALDATGDHQVLDYVWLATEPTDFWPSKGTPLTFGELHHVMASEILSDLTALAEKAEK
ncbi:hypothetical protein GCM10010402_43450 [Actinomadura luteofluorescens]|uniref:DUF4132 domain-containing protein n=1 Tax=Actinomadura luteofluorescens TaxID=46163 RepID=UPI0027DB1FA2|nr:DUF4132 domain-containing protein [Actinomadura glauciflava]MCR3743395.1 protein of unknown function (DUF4132) [Actinomadura glauciflava]